MAQPFLFRFDMNRNIKKKKRNIASNIPKKKKSLLIVSFPRSLSSLIFKTCNKKIPYLKIDRSSSKIIENGEIFNYLNDYKKTQFCLKSNKSYERCRKTLDKYTDGYLIKDVVQPLMVEKYIQENPDNYNVLYIERDIAEVAHRMWDRKWMWPTTVLGEGKKYTAKKYCKEGEHWKEGLTALIRALLFIQDNSFNSYTKKVKYKDIIQNEKHLNNALRNMGYNLKKEHYIDDAFLLRASNANSIRKTKLFKTIKYIIRKLNDQRE